MQAAKDSFYMAVRDRLAALNPARTMVVDGVTLPAIVVRENLEPQFTEAQPGAFYLDWGEVQVAESTRPILGLDCHIWYASEGSGGAGVDRGRALAQMDEELLRICNPPHTGMRDYSLSPSASLGSSIFWTMPDLAQAPGEVPIATQQRGAAREICADQDLLFSAGGWSMTRTGLRPVSRQTRAFFAPVDRVNGPTAIFDPSKDYGFQVDSPPAPWIDLGWIENFQRTSTTQIEPLTGGVAGAVSAQARHGLGARIDFEFRDWGKLQMALAGGAEHMNVLATDTSASRAGSGGIPVGAVALLAGSTAVELVLGAGAIDGFEPGDLVACDVDYAQQVGFVGSGIAAAYVKNPGDVRQDANYVRRVTFNVARVAQKTATSLLLAQALPGGAPASAASVQKVIAFVDREGGAFLQQWSGLFVMEEESGGRVCLFYPSLSPCTAKAAWERESLVEIQKPIGLVALRASFTALPTIDGNDGAVVLCYRSYFPASNAPVY